MEIKKLISFDFDDTLVHTTLPDEGKLIWKEKTGEEVEKPKKGTKKKIPNE